MAMQNVYDFFAVGRDSLLGHETGYASSRDGYGASYPLPAHETSFAPEEEGGDQSSDLVVKIVSDKDFQAELQAMMYEVAVGPKPEAEVFLSDVGQLLSAMEHMQADGHLNGSQRFEMEALAEEMQRANPDETTEQIIERMQAAWDFICDLRQAYLAGEVEHYLTGATETTDSRPGREQLLGSRA